MVYKVYEINLVFGCESLRLTVFLDFFSDRIADRYAEERRLKQKLMEDLESDFGTNANDHFYSL